MLLAYFEGLGVITGFAIGYFIKRVSDETNPKVRKMIFVGSGIILGLGIILGGIWYFWVYPHGDWAVAKNCIMGFFFLGTVGWAMGMFAEWFAKKYFQK